VAYSLQPNPQAEAELTWNEFCKSVRGRLQGHEIPAQISVDTWREELQEQWARAESKIQKSSASDLKL
jgi:hypothetical protein